LLDPRLDGLDLRIHLPHESRYLVAAPLLELLIGWRGNAGQAVTCVVTRYAGGVVALVLTGEPYVVVLNAVDIEVVDYVHRNVDGVLLDEWMPRIEGLVGHQRTGIRE